MVEKSKNVNLLNWLTSKLSNVAFSGDYNDLSNKPTTSSSNSTLLNLSVVYEDETTETIPLLVATSVNES